jgi:CheY-like chemotaxis protein
VSFSPSSVTSAVMDRMAATRATPRPVDQPVSRPSAYRLELRARKGRREQHAPKGLPVIDADCGTCDAAGDKTGPSLRSGKHLGTILVVVEDRAMAAIICELLEEAGFRVVSASGFWDALSCVESQNFDLMITDAVLPGAFSGVELVIHARSLNPALKSLFVSDYGPVIDDPERDDFVSKPFRPRELLGCTFELHYRRLPVIRRKWRGAELTEIQAKITALRPSRERRSRDRTDLRRAPGFSPAPVAAPVATGTQGD